MAESFNGQVTIKVRFRNNPEYVKFRTYILKTDWMPGDAYPTWEDLVIDFHSVEDLDRITRRIVQLLQMGFEVYSTRYKLESQLAEEEYPPDDLEPEAYDDAPFDFDEFHKDIGPPKIEEVKTSESIFKEEWQ